MLLPCAIEADKPVGGQDLEVGRMKVLATTVGRTDEDPLLQTETASFSDVSRLSQLRRCFWRCCPGLVVKRAGQDQLWLEESHEEEPLEGHSLKLG